MLGVASLPNVRIGRFNVFSCACVVLGSLLLPACGGGGGGSGGAVPAPIVSAPVSTPTPTPTQNQIVFTSDRSVALSSTGQIYQFSAHIQTPSGSPVSGTLTWSSSAPSQVSVDQTGKATALTAVGSATITVTAPGTQPQVATVIVAQPAVGTVIVPSADVQSVTATQAVLAADAITTTIRSGNIVVSGDKGQLLNTVTSVQAGASTVTLGLAPASLVQAFQQLNIDLESTAASQVRVSLRHGLATFTSNGATRTRQLSPSDFQCTDPSGNPVSVTLTLPSFSLPSTNLPVHFVLTHGGGSTTAEYSVSGDIPFSIQGGSATFQGTGNAVSCVATLGTIGMPAPSPIGLQITGEVTLTVGLNLSASGSAEVTVSAPTVSGTLHIYDGIRFVNGVWQPIMTNSQDSTVTPGSMTFGSSITAGINPFARFDFGAKASLWGIPAADFSFAYAQGTGELSISDQSPFSVADVGYTGPSWNASVDLRAGPEVVLNSGLLADVFDYIGISKPDSEWTAFEKSYPLSASPQINLSASTSSVKTGPVTFSVDIPCSTKLCPNYANDTVEFWIFKSGASTGSKLLTATVGSAGQASAQWTPTGSDNGTYSIVAYLYDSIFGAHGFPYASSPISLDVNETVATPAPVPSSSPSSSPTPSPTSTPSVALSFSSISPNSITTSQPGAEPTLTANGSNFMNVNRITFSWTGATAGPAVWTKGDSNWSSKVHVISDSMMTLAPVVTQSSDAPGIVTWTVTLTDTSGASKSQTFTVDYTPTSSVPGAFSLTANAYCNTTSPVAPAVMLTWTAASGATSYDIYKNGALVPTSVTGTSFDNNINVVAGQTYTYYIVANNSAGSTASNSVTVSIPANICPTAALTFTTLSPNSINTSTAGYEPQLTALGSGFLSVDEIVFVWSGVSTGNSTWTPSSPNWRKVTIASDGTMYLNPVVTQLGDSAGISYWTVTIYDSSGASASQTFTVNYTP